MPTAKTPPKTGRPLGYNHREYQQLLQQLADDCRAEPGQWKQYPEVAKRSTHGVIYRIRKGHTETFRNGFEARPGVTGRVEVRWIGIKEQVA